MRQGIFTGKTTLGVFGSDSDSMPCEGTEFVTEIQQALKSKAMPGLRTDGVWDGCTTSAWRKLVGSPLVDVSQVQAVTGKTCTSGYVDMPNGMRPLLPGPWLGVFPQCTDGTDMPAVKPLTPPVPVPMPPVVPRCAEPTVPVPSGNPASPWMCVAPMVSITPPAPCPEGQERDAEGACGPLSVGTRLANMFGGSTNAILVALAIGVGAVVVLKKKKGAALPPLTPNRRAKRRSRY